MTTVLEVPPFAGRRDLACRGADPEIFFARKSGPEGRGGRPTYDDHAAELCGICPAEDACLAWALGHDLSYGIWGGLNPPERRALLKARGGA